MNQLNQLCKNTFYLVHQVDCAVLTLTSVSLSRASTEAAVQIWWTPTSVSVQLGTLGTAVNALGRGAVSKGMSCVTLMVLPYIIYT